MKHCILIFLILLSGNISAQSWEQKVASSLAYIGKPIQQIEMIDSKGNDRSFDELKQQKTVIYFFASWCAPCFDSLKKIEELSANNEVKVNLIALALDNDKSAVQAMIERAGFTGAVWLATEGEKPLQERFFANGYQALPYTVVLDEELVLVEASYNVDLESQWAALLINEHSLEQIKSMY